MSEINQQGHEQKDRPRTKRHHQDHSYHRKVIRTSSGALIDKYTYHDIVHDSKGRTYPRELVIVDRHQNDPARRPPKRISHALKVFSSHDSNDYRHIPREVLSNGDDKVSRIPLLEGGKRKDDGTILSRLERHAYEPRSRTTSTSRHNMNVTLPLSRVSRSCQGSPSLAQPRIPAEGPGSYRKITMSNAPTAQLARVSTTHGNFMPMPHQLLEHTVQSISQSSSKQAQNMTRSPNHKEQCFPNKRTNASRTQTLSSVSLTPNGVDRQSNASSLSVQEPTPDAARFLQGQRHQPWANVPDAGFSLDRNRIGGNDFREGRFPGQGFVPGVSEGVPFTISDFDNQRSHIRGCRGREQRRNDGSGNDAGIRYELYESMRDI